MRQGVRQNLAGIVVNRKVNLRRADLEVLEATLINCVRRGHESQNRAGVPDFRAHLAGRIGLVETIDSAKAQRLRTVFEAIEWER
jgi:RNA-directed DNA polymerase